MPPKKRASTRKGSATSRQSNAQQGTTPLSVHTSLAQLRAMTMPILRGHLTERQLSTGGNKEALVKRLLTDLQSGQEPDQTSPEGPTSGEEDQADGQPFTAAQQAALETAVRAALTKVHSPTLSDPSTSTSRKRYRPSSRGRRRKRCPSSSSRSSSSSSDPASQPSSSSTPESRSTTASPRKRSRYSSSTPSPKKRERASRKKHASSNKRSRGRLRKRKHRHHQTSSRSLPVPQKLSKSIVRGEFIEFPKLLAEHMAMSGVLKKPKSGHKPEPRGITGLDTWLEAWCVFASVLTAAKPRLAPDLFRYQNYIILASRRFQPHAWLQYDIQFRLKKASNPSMSWSTADPEITATWLSADAILPTINCYLVVAPITLPQFAQPIQQANQLAYAALYAMVTVTRHVLAQR